jgi:LysM repeat protein
MNTPNPLVPQGSLLEQQKSKGKSNLFTAVIIIMAIHVVLFGGLLIQGCKPESKPGGLTVNEPTNAPPLQDTNTFIANLPPVVDTNPPVVLNAATNPPIAPLPGTPIVSTPPLESQAGAKEYKVAKGDTFAKIGKAHGVTAAAIAKANPGVDSTKLKVGQTIQIPAAGATPGAAALAVGGTESTVAPMEAAAPTVYTVKPNDNLTKVAKAHGTTVKAVRALNNLKTDRLSVGQKLKMPAPKAVAASAASPASASVPMNNTTPGMSPATNPAGVPAPMGR